MTDEIITLELGDGPDEHAQLLWEEAQGERERDRWDAEWRPEHDPGIPG